MIKLSEFEKLEAKRKKSESKKAANGKEKDFSDKNMIRSNTPPLKDFKGRLDYNALDYEDQSDEENNVSRKQVPSLVQYPLPGAYNKFKSEEEVKKEQERVEKEMEEVVALNKRSDFLAMALGKYICLYKNLSIKIHFTSVQKLMNYIEYLNLCKNGNRHIRVQVVPAIIRCLPLQSFTLSIG